MSKVQQKQISASDNEGDEEDDLTILEDVLPSFEMHNYMFNRTIYDTENITSSGKPPGYEDLGIGNNNSNMEPRDLNNFVDPTRNPNLLLLNNLEKFQRIDLPISIQIVLTKTAPRLGIVPERENPLKQYKPGDVMHGYIIIENRSEEEIPFEMLLVSLEGEMTTPNPNKPNELIRKPFLKTYDLSACFHYGFIDLEYQGLTLDTRIDQFDHTYLGFDNDRMISPNKKHKKFFSFKLPHYLLDTSCSDQLPSHLKLPPSFGVDNNSFQNMAKFIKVDPIQGYGRLDRYGSPIKTIDYASDGQSISYFINVQFIGRKLDFYKKFYTHETSHEYDFIFLKNIEYNFRIDSSTSHSNDYYTMNETSTNQQIKFIETLVSDKLNEIIERKNLKEVGIEDPRNQDEIIFSSTSTNKKREQLSHNNSDDLFPIITDTKTSMTDMDGFSRAKTVKIIKDIFSKVDGDLNIRIGIHRNAKLKSIKPRQLQLASAKSHSKPNSSLNLSSMVKSLPTNPPSFESITSPQLTPTSSSESILHKFIEKEYLYIYFSFKSSDSKRNSKTNLPTTITISPNLKIYNVQSPFPIPITFDNKFIFNGGFEIDNIQNIRKKFAYYYHQLCDALRDTDTGLVRSLYNKINSLSRLFVSEQTVKKFFESQTIDLTNQWKLNLEKNIYECEFQIPLNIDIKSEKISSLCIVPSFQQCLLSRFYGVEVEVVAKKAKEKVNM
ncbi:hypothetical protein C6P40_003966, partial [Pichia californica]